MIGMPPDKKTNTIVDTIEKDFSVVATSLEVIEMNAKLSRK